MNRTPTHTACTDAHSVSAHHTAQSDHFSSRELAWLTRRVSFLAAPDTDHQHKFSLTYLSNLTVILFDTPKPVVPRSIFSLRRFTAKTNNYGRCWVHRGKFRSEKETLILLENTEFQGNLINGCTKREASAQRTQADHSRRESPELGNLITGGLMLTRSNS